MLQECRPARVAFLDPLPTAGASRKPSSFTPIAAGRDTLRRPRVDNLCKD